MARYVLILVVIICILIDTNAQIINVPSTQNTIQAGIDAASEGDTVLVAEGTYYENIDFRGRAITVASQFILDGDTSHISNTIIDGSQYNHPDTLSTVLMISGEDTTSVLTGFTITGGSGTVFSLDDAPWDVCGGGIYILGSGGKIIHNIIENNHLASEDFQAWLSGGAIHADVYNNHTLIVRNNVIRDNSVTGERVYGAGATFSGGKLLVENNRIIYNELQPLSVGWGAGINYENRSWAGTIHEVIIRNNIISNNMGGSGCGITLGSGFEQERIQLYNNLISGNHAFGSGGGLHLDSARVSIFNNSISNNIANENGNSMSFGGEGDIVIYNNIVWSDVMNGLTEYYYQEDFNPASFNIYYNLLKEFLTNGNPVHKENVRMQPVFIPDSYELAELSPGIGQGVDSVLIDGFLFYAPLLDLYDNPRPDTIDYRIDMGAIESPYEGIVQIPDTAFLYALIDEAVDANGDSLVSYDEAEAVVSLDIGGDLIIGPGGSTREITGKIESLEGIGAFRNLKYLDCPWNIISYSNFSQNLLLRELDISFNPISRLDLSLNTELVDLICAENQLTTLNVSNNTALTQLWCPDNLLTTLDLSNNTNLEVLRCSGNPLSDLNLSSNPSLVDIRIFDMETLGQVCVWTMPFPPEGVKVDYTNSPNVYFTTICGASNVYIPDTAFLFALIERGVDTDEDNLISYAEAEVVNMLNVSSENISDLTGLEAFVKLDTFICLYNQISELDISNQISLVYLDLNNNQLTSLDLSNNTSLQTLYCGENQLSELDISASVGLKSLGCSANNLASLDVSNNALLTSLDCSVNQLDTLDVTHNGALALLLCSENQIRNIDLSNDTVLTFLWIAENNLTDLDISNNPALISLKCSHNQLTTLDVSGNINLASLVCEDNLIAGLDVSNNPEIYELWCGGNLLESLDLRMNTALGSVDLGTYALNLKDMPMLEKVCVWTWPFPPEGLEMETTGSPNICFTNDCEGGCDTGIDNDQSSNLTLYPNPAKTHFIIKADHPGHYAIEITSLNGHLIHSTFMDGNSLKIDLSAFPRGVYFITIRSEEYTLTEKVVKL